MNIGGVIINDWNQYKLNSNIIIGLIKKSYSEYEIKFEEPKGIDLYTVQIGSNIMITILPTNNWINIKKDIDSKINNMNQFDYHNSNNKFNLCRLCKLEIEIKTECNKCKKSSCIECYIKNFKKNKGIIKCDNCNFSFGQKTPDSYIDILIDDIREKANKMNKIKK